MASFKMSPERKKLWHWRIMAVLYVIFILAYISGVFVFAFEFYNYWAAAGFSVTIVLIGIRLAMHLVPEETLYRAFPAASFTRALFQTMCLAVGFAFLALGIYLLAQGLQRHQKWTGESMFCGMIGQLMASKWGFFCARPLYELRPDTMSSELRAKLREFDGDEHDSTAEKLSTDDVLVKDDAALVAHGERV